MSAEVVALARRPLSAHSVLARAFELLQARGVPVRVAVVTEDRPLPPATAGASLVVLRDVPVATLAALSNTGSGVPCCNPVEATASTMDKGETDRLLRAAGVTVPASEVTTSWAAVTAASAERQLAVKPRTGRDGRGVVLAAHPTELPKDPPYPGPYLVQQLVPGDGVDRKLYVVGQRVFGVLRRWPAPDLTWKRGRPYDPTAAERSTAIQTGEALGLEVFGVDLLGNPDAPVVVDVNPMPGFQGVPGIETHLSDHFFAHCRSRQVAS